MTPLHDALRDPLVSCGGRHRAYFEPRPLCEVGDPIVTDWQLPPLLEVAVSACSPEVAGSPSPALIILRGELDTYAASQIRGALLEYARFASNIVLDLSSVRMIDSGGIVLVESIQRALARRGGFLTIHDPSLIVERVLQICGIGDSISTCRPTAAGLADAQRFPA